MSLERQEALWNMSTLLFLERWRRIHDRSKFRFEDKVLVGDAFGDLKSIQDNTFDLGSPLLHTTSRIQQQWYEGWAREMGKYSNLRLCRL